MRTLKSGALVVLIATLTLSTSCATNSQPTLEQIKSADYGEPITQADAQDAAKRYISGKLKDPYSAVYQWDPVRTGWLRDPIEYGARDHFGYVISGTLNAKNSYGAYEGPQEFFVCMHNGNIETVLLQSVGPFGNKVLRKL